MDPGNPFVAHDGRQDPPELPEVDALVRVAGDALICEALDGNDMNSASLPGARLRDLDR